MPSILKKLSSSFTGFRDKILGTTSASERGTAAKRITSKLVSYIIELSNFSEQLEEDIYQQLYLWEPEVGSSIDKLSTLVRQSVQEIYLKDVGEKLEPNEEECLKIAKEVSIKMEMPDQFESFTELLLTFGNLFLGNENHDFIQYEIFPNKLVTLVDKLETIGAKGTVVEQGKMFGDYYITQANYLVLQEDTQYQKIYKKDQFIHVKYKTTPIFSRDLFRRMTYGIYSPSPLHRTVLSVWQKRQLMIIDILFRWRVIPREHHIFDSSLWSLDAYEGATMNERIQASKNAADTYLNDYISKISEQMPDQGYATTDTTKIETIGGKSAVNYMEANRLLEQITKTIWTALNTPPSIVTGQDAGSYASELVISNYVSTKVIQLAEKVKYPILKSIQARVKAIDASLPVERLDIKLELTLAVTKLELFRQAAIMAAIGVFTDTEIRELLHYLKLTDEQRQYIISAERTKTVGDITRDTGIKMPGELRYPETSHSSDQHKQDPSQIMGRAMEK